MALGIAFGFLDRARTAATTRHNLTLYVCLRVSQWCESDPINDGEKNDRILQQKFTEKDLYIQISVLRLRKQKNVETEGLAAMQIKQNSGPVNLFANFRHCTAMRFRDYNSHEWSISIRTVNH